MNTDLIRNVIDLRSDTVTKPTAAMRAAMCEADVGDDVFGDDPTVALLEQKVAQLLGKQQSVYVPSGVMANQLAVRVHCQPGQEAICHAGCHIFNYEGGAAAALSGVTLRPLASGDGTLNPAEILANIHGDTDAHLAVTRLICFENTHNACGGAVVSQQNIFEVSKIAREYGLAMHLDGARLMNAAIASGMSATQLAAPFDTVSLCLSKGLGAPIGSVLAGGADQIAKARRFRKLFGGGMRQVGILAAAGLYALSNHVDRLADDHHRASALAHGIAAIRGLTCDAHRFSTNLVYFDLDPQHPRAASPKQGRIWLTEALQKQQILISGGPYRLRIVTHLDIDDNAVERTLRALSEIMA